MLTRLNVVMNVTTTLQSPFDFRPDDVLLGALPLLHPFGQICGMSTCFQAVATLVLMPRFDARQALDLMASEHCTLFMGVPTMYLALLAEARSDPGPTKLDRAFSGGAALPVKVLDEFEATFGCPIYEGYGLTETSPVVAYDQKAWPRRPGTVGRPIWGVDVEIAKADVDDAIELLPAGERGEVVIRGHNMMAGCLNRPEATAGKDMVLRGGYNVYPREVEETLTHHPAIDQVAVIGIPHKVHGEEVYALAAEIVAWAKERMAAYKYPRVVLFVDAFPLGPSGKAPKRELIAHIQSGD